jgi:peptide/nickel transport system permease protein
LVRGEFLSLRSRDFVDAARVIGTSDRRIIFRHILPNAMPTIIVNTTLRISWTIIMEASLSFVGLRDPRYITLGNMINYSVQYTRIAWWMPTFPGFVIFILVLIFNLIGDGLNEALNPKEKRVEG